MQNAYRWQPLPALSWLRSAWKRKCLILLSWAVLGGLAAAVIYSLPVIYRAEAVVLVESQRIPARFVTPTVTSDLNDRLATLREQVLSYSRLLSIANRYNLYREKRRSHPEEAIVEMMRQDTAVKLERGWTQDQPGAFRIAYHSRDAAQAAQVANELAESFIDQNGRSRDVSTVGTAEFLRELVADARRRLAKQEARIAEYKRAHIGELPHQESTLASSLSQLQLRLQNVNEQLSRAQQNKTVRESDLETALASQSEILRLSQEAAEADAVSALGLPSRERESTQLERQLALMRGRYTENHPKMKVLREAIERARASEAEQADAARAVPSTPPPSDGKPLLNGSLVAQRERVEQLRALQGVAAKQIEEIEGERSRTLRELGAVQSRLQQLPIRERQIAGLARDYEITKADFQSLLDKQLAAQMAAEMEQDQKSECFTVLDSARTPKVPVQPDRPLLTLAGAGGALLLAAGLGFAVELRSNVLLGEWELPEGTPVLGRVPLIAIGQAADAPTARHASSTVVQAT